MAEYIVTTKNLTKVYGSGETAVKALDNVDFNVEYGEFVAVVGASGSGKSTLLHMLGAMDSPTEGKVVVDGTDVFASKKSQLAVYRRRRVGFVFQFFNLIPVMTAKENILLPIMLDSQKIDESYFNDVVKTLGLTERLNHYPHQLSGGQQQRVSIARALIAKPAIILADEPTGNLDTHNSREIIAMLRQMIAKYSQTLVLITHDPQIAAAADRVVRISDGRIVETEA